MALTENDLICLEGEAQRPVGLPPTPPPSSVNHPARAGAAAPPPRTAAKGKDVETWADLTEAEKLAANHLGYDSPAWNQGDEPATFRLPWARLTPRDRVAAMTLGYFAGGWDAELHDRRTTYPTGVVTYPTATTSATEAYPVTAPGYLSRRDTREKASTQHEGRWRAALRGQGDDRVTKPCAPLLSCPRERGSPGTCAEDSSAAPGALLRHASTAVPPHPSQPAPGAGPPAEPAEATLATR